jgi:hypothetical protein
VQDEHNAKLAKCGRKQWKPIQPLSTNDIALHDGGIFDWLSTWAPSHQTHNKGEGGDFNRFGAGGDNSGLNFANTGIECDGSTLIKQYWYAHVLLCLGTAYGHWDCSDLSGSPAVNSSSVPWNPLLSVNGAISRSACEAGEFSDPTYFPPRLHLHVKD